jgi:hypothetical protein
MLAVVVAMLTLSASAQARRGGIAVPPPVVGASAATQASTAPVIRESADWWSVQPDAGTWNWSQTDATYRRVGRRWQPILADAPPWAGGGWAVVRQDGEVQQFRRGPTDLGAFARYAARFVSRYRPRTVEIWNEPDLVFFWYRPNAAAYRRLYLLAYRAIKHVSPGTKVLLAIGVNDDAKGWFVNALRGLPSDGVAVHIYRGTAWLDKQQLSDAEHAVRRNHLNPNVYVTEIGYWPNPGVCIRPDQVPGLLRALEPDPMLRQIDPYYC